VEGHEIAAHQDKRRNILTAELEPVTDEQHWSDLIIQAPPLYVQEKADPKVLIAQCKWLPDVIKIFRCC
jgi:hypothetical protein